jgi:phenylalanyl-tRNA synthetase alpha chain
MLSAFDVSKSLQSKRSTTDAIGVLTDTAHADLPSAAIERLGMSAQQKNLLVRIIIRPLERTLSGEEARRIRDRVYGAIHRGSNHQWASRCDSAAS